MENPPTIIRPPPPPLPPQIYLPDNMTNFSFIGSPPPLPFFSSSPQTVTIMNFDQPPPFPDSPESLVFPPLEFILALLAVITIPALIYSFLFAVKGPPWSSRDRHDEPPELPTDNHGDSTAIEVTETRRKPVSGPKYRKENHSKEIGNECPVCLLVFGDEEEVKQLSECKHSFHTSCIDFWLNNHDNCPVCRTPVAVKMPNNNRAPPSDPARDSDHHQGLPDAASQV